VQATWRAQGVYQPIFDLVNTYSNLTVSGGPTWISKVTVSLDITHTWDADLDIYLVAPDGAEVELSTDNGGLGDNYTNTTFDDAAATPVTAGVPPFTGTFSPEGLLSALSGKNANGTWRLRVYDDGGSSTGSITEWSLTIE
jgi:subtilisin-like proprotein convertase family protein